jgi:dihydrofolate reductase
MRALKLQMQLSLDGYCAGPKGELDWMVWNWDDALKNYVAALTDPVDCIVMGRNLASGFIPHWAKIAENPDDPEYAFARKIADTPKVVFTRTLEKSDWPNTVLAKGDLAVEINTRKQQDGQDIIAYGGAEFVSSLLKAGLIDELHLFVNPVLLGAGMGIFGNLEGRQNLTLGHSQAFACGIVVLKYVPKKDEKP